MQLVSNNYGHPWQVVCSCKFCASKIYDDEPRTIRCPVCFGHLRLSLNLESDEVRGFWSAWECEGVCGTSWTNVEQWAARQTPRAEGASQERSA